MLVVTDRSDQPAMRSKAGEILRDVPRDSTRRNIDLARARVTHTHLAVRCATDIDIGATDDGCEWCVTDDVTATLDDALANQVHDVPANGRPADTKAVRDSGLGDQRVLANHRQYLLFALGHDQTIVCLTNYCW